MIPFLLAAILVVLVLIWIGVAEISQNLRRMSVDTQQLKKLTEQLKGPTESLEKAVNENKKE